MQQQSSSGTIVNIAKTRLSGFRLILARTIVLVLVIPSLGLTVVSFPVYYSQIQKPCLDATTCNFAGAMTAKGLQVLAALGVSVNGYAAFNTIFWAAIFVIWGGIGLLIFWRRSDDGMALLAAFFLMMFSTGTTSSALAFTYPTLSMLVVILSFLGQVSLWLFFLLFPNGRLVPRWMGVIIPLIVIQAVLFVAPPTSPFSQNSLPRWLSALLALTIPGAIIFSQIYRYRHVSSAVERQQTKWVAFAIGTVAAGFIVFGLLFNVFLPIITEPDSPYSLFQFVYPLLLLLLPISIGIAILRYRLYDIDVLINRTLVYGMLTVMLTLTYFGLVIGLESLVRLFTGQALQSPVIIVASTLAIAALFRPLRRRLQTIIDRRFYRHKYDAARTLAAFSLTLRNEVDVHQLRKHLLAVVEETMQPAHVSLWLRQDEQRSKLHTDVSLAAHDCTGVSLSYKIEVQEEEAFQGKGKLHEPIEDK
jgi:hypothetical protein